MVYEDLADSHQEADDSSQERDHQHAHGVPRDNRYEDPERQEENRPAQPEADRIAEAFEQERDDPSHAFLPRFPVYRGPRCTAIRVACCGERTWLLSTYHLGPWHFPAATADNGRLATQLRSIALFDGGREGVHVDVQDREAGARHPGTLANGTGAGARGYFYPNRSGPTVRWYILA
jgi:hypothetical protein